MTLEKIQCPICKSEMFRSKTTQSLISNDPTHGDFEMPVDYMVCGKCHNLQTFVIMKVDNHTEISN